MAKKSIADPIADLSPKGLHEYARSLLREIGEYQDQAYSVASAASSAMGDDDVNAKNLFNVISGICEDTTVARSLERVIDQLAKLAGSEVPKAATGNA